MLPSASHIVLSTLLLLFTANAFGQSAQTEGDEEYRTIKLPVLGLSAGWSFLNGDVSNDGSGTGAIGQFGYNLSISQMLKPYVSISLDLATGKLFGDQMISDTVNINYRTTIISQGLRVFYEASHLFKQPNQNYITLQPYLGVGIGLISFRAKGDLKDSNGNKYHFWSNGSIMDMEDSPANQDMAAEIERDYIYESDLRDADLDGFGRYDQMALQVPIELGFRYQFTKHIGAHIKGTYHFNFTDLIDNVSENSLEGRTGSVGNDNHISASIGVSIYMGEYQRPIRKKPQVETIPEIAEADKSLGDNDSDQNDDPSSNTERKSEQQADSDANEVSDPDQEKNPEDIAIDKSIVPSSSTEVESNENAVSAINDDSDPDQENNSHSTNNSEQELDTKRGDESIDTTVDTIEERTELAENKDTIEHGEVNSLDQTDDNTTDDKTNTDARNETVHPTETSGTQTTEGQVFEDSGTSRVVISDTNKEESTNDPSVEALDMIDRTMGIESTQPKPVGEYHWADLNKNHYISADEVLHFIDVLFDGDSKYTIPMIHELIEYYFDQD